MKGMKIKNYQLKLFVNVHISLETTTSAVVNVKNVVNLHVIHNYSYSNSWSNLMHKYIHRHVLEYNYSVHIANNNQHFGVLIMK